MAAQGPLLLFDGVCNLCSGWVQWVIRRDRGSKFRFASLQSEAGRAAVREAGADPGTLPDSLVLIDAGELSTRSSAALMVLGGLGFPLSLLTILLLVPRALRDGVYDLIARRRYDWFGRNERCMLPTPELRARFLDADEPRPVLEPRSPPLPARGGLGAALRGWWVRFALVYVVVYMLPFPLSLQAYLQPVPLLGWITAPLGLLTSAHQDVTQWTVSVVAELLFGIDDLDFTFTGSGDRLVNYLDLLLDLALALVVTGLWSLRVRGAHLSARVLDGARVLARYYLATTMLTYGWVKLFPLQFPAPGADRLLQAYGDSSPMGIAWTFLGASTGYQMFAGSMELLGGYLLFWRRTTALGALVVLGVMTNVAAINIFYDVPVKLFSMHLVLVALFLVVPELPRILGALVFNLPTSARPALDAWSPGRRRARAGRMLKALLIVGVTLSMVLSNSARYAQTSDESALAGLYQVESFTRAGVRDRDNLDAERWVRVGLRPPYVATIQRADGSAVRMRIELDEDAGTLSFFDRGGAAPEEPQFTYEVLESGDLRLDGRFEDAEQRIDLRLQEQPSLLRSRGFRWVNEYPFNR